MGLVALLREHGGCLVVLLHPLLVLLLLGGEGVLVGEAGEMFEHRGVYLRFVDARLDLGFADAGKSGKLGNVPFRILFG